jgi:hypothetical protein
MNFNKPIKRSKLDDIIPDIIRVEEHISYELYWKLQYQLDIKLNNTLTLIDIILYNDLYNQFSVKVSV